MFQTWYPFNANMHFENKCVYLHGSMNKYVYIYIMSVYYVAMISWLGLSKTKKKTSQFVRVIFQETGNNQSITQSIHISIFLSIYPFIYLLICASSLHFAIYLYLSVLSCPVLSCPVLSCPVLSCPVLSCPVLSCPVLSCPVLSCPVLSCPVLSCPVLSCPVHPSIYLISKI